MSENGNADEAEADPEKEGRDLVFDFDEITPPDLGSLCLVLTATVLADADHRRVWIHGLPEPAWRVLRALGLSPYFSVLPPPDHLLN